jgi:hypothetical protein
MTNRPCFLGIYGFEITRSIKVGPFQFHPRFSSSKEAQKMATDRDGFNLTSICECKEELNHGNHSDLSAALTFCQQQSVFVTKGVYMPDGTSVEQGMDWFPQQVDLPYQRPTQGALIQSDANARQNFLELCLARLADDQFEQRTSFRNAFFRNVESWKTQFIEVRYYLNFGALEILARKPESDFTSNVASVAAKFLQKLGFTVMADTVNERHLAIRTYAHLRNALFHNGQFEKTIDENGKQVTLRLVDYEDYLCRLVPDVLLKVLGYTDSRRNWSFWVDRMRFH